MKTKCPKQLGHLVGEEDHQYGSHYEIKPHPKNVWQSPENPLTHPKCELHQLRHHLLDYSKVSRLEP